MKRSLLIGTVLALMALAACGGRSDAARARRPSTTVASPTTVAATLQTSSTVAVPGVPTTSIPAAAAGASVECDRSTSTLTPGRATIDVGGEQREYLLALPSSLDAATPAPLIFDFHGSGSNMDEEFAYSRMSPEGTARGYIVVTPQGTGTPRGWSLRGPGTDDAFVDAMIAAVGAGTCLDRSRVFAVGISNGSAYSALLACRDPDRIAAVGMVAATLPSLCPIDRPVPAVAFHGTADPIVPYGGGTVNSERTGTEAPGAEGAIAQWAQRNGCAPTPKDTAYAADVMWRHWSGCTDDASVQFFSIVGGGHTWPGAIDLKRLGKGFLGATTQSVSATKVLLDFFDSIPSAPNG